MHIVKADVFDTSTIATVSDANFGRGDYGATLRFVRNTKGEWTYVSGEPVSAAFGAKLDAALSTYVIKEATREANRPKRMPRAQQLTPERVAFLTKLAQDSLKAEG